LRLPGWVQRRGDHCLLLLVFVNRFYLLAGLDRGWKPTKVSSGAFASSRMSESRRKNMTGIFSGGMRIFENRRGESSRVVVGWEDCQESVTF
jgi:hypothetical protein